MIRLTRENVVRAFITGMRLPPVVRGKILPWARVLLVDDEAIVIALPRESMRKGLQPYVPAIQRTLRRKLIVLVGEESDFPWHQVTTSA